MRLTQDKIKQIFGYISIDIRGSSDKEGIYQLAKKIRDGSNLGVDGVATIGDAMILLGGDVVRRLIALANDESRQFEPGEAITTQITAINDLGVSLANWKHTPQSFSSEQAKKKAEEVMAGCQEFVRLMQAQIKLRKWTDNQINLFFVPLN